MKKLSEMLKYYRTVASFSMLELAEKAGVSNSYINEIEKGRKIPPYDTLQKIMTALMLNDSQKQELIELTKTERFQHKVNTEQKKLSEMTHDEREKVLDEYRADLPGIPINYIDKPSEEVAAMGEAEVNYGLSGISIAFNAFNKLTLEEKKILLTLFNDSIKGK